MEELLYVELYRTMTIIVKEELKIQGFLSRSESEWRASPSLACSLKCIQVTLYLCSFLRILGNLTSCEHYLNAVVSLKIYGSAIQWQSDHRENYCQALISIFLNGDSL